LAAFLAVFLMLGFLPSFELSVRASEAPVLDQVNEVYTTQESMYGFYIAQTFTAGKTGVLSNPDLYLYTQDSVDAGFRVWIEEVIDDPQDLYYGMPESTKMIGYSLGGNYENERWIKGAPDSWAWYSFTFGQMARVQAGKKYAICFQGISGSAEMKETPITIRAESFGRSQGQIIHGENQFITMLLRAYEISAEASSTDNIADAGSTYYTSYLAAAKRLGIASGVGGNRFAPDKAITCQEMFMLYNALKSVDKLPTGTSGTALSGFSAASDIAFWAQNAMSVC